MKEYILLLPIIFIFHDMEEIIGFGWFFRKNPQLFRKHPKLTNAYREFTNEGFAIGVYEEFIPFFGVSLLAYYFPGAVLNALWYGLFLALTGHFAAHILICIYVGKFIPSVITSVICLPVSILIMVKSAAFLTFDTQTVILTVCAVLALILNMKIDHKLMFALGKKFQ